MKTAYEAQKYEKNILKKWKNNNVSQPETKEQNVKKSGKKISDNTFCVPIPPPNVTGQLHLGHAMMLVIQDIMTRYNRMNGTPSLWVPGTDHAAIATETVVLKNLGVPSREEFSREEFLEKCFEHTKNTHATISGQVEKMGATCDFSRERFTMDFGMSNAVQKIFSDLYAHNLIVRGYRMINWSTGAQSVLSDDELEYEDQKDTFCYIKCGKFVMGTVRAETKCADSPLVLHPNENYVKAKFTNSDAISEEFIFSEVLFDDEERRTKIFNQLDPNGTWEKISVHQGKEFEGEEFSYQTYSGKRNFFVLCDDEVIDINKGTGAMTISVCHSADDYLLAKKYPEKLKDYYTEKIDFYGKMTKIAGELEGVEVKIARKRAVKLMQAQNLIVGLEKDYLHNVPLCYRTGCVIEPMISPQWFIDVNKKFNWVEGVGVVNNRHDHSSDTIQQKSLKELTSEAINRGEYNKNSDLVNLVPNRFTKIYDQWIDNLQDWCISRQIWWGHQIPIWYDTDGNQHVAQEQTVLFTRHGESENNVNKIICGDSPLTAKGISQAEEAGKILQQRNITKIISSPAERALHTATIIGKNIAYSEEIETWDILKEFHAGKYENQPIDETSNKTALEKILEDDGYDAIEPYVRIAERFWEKIKTVETDGEILIVSHNALTSFLFAVKNGATKETIVEHWKRWKMDNCEIKESLVMIPPQGHQNMRQDEDTLDTWFSSALWPFSTLGWPDKTPDFDKFFPTSVLETGHDILFFWVARMIMFSRFTTGKNPFSDVYLHGLVCDEHGKKMSKSKGNGIDPLEMIEKFGTDAVRMSLIVGTTPGNQVSLGEKKIEGFRNFANKLWNVARYILSIKNNEHDCASPKEKSLPEKWILSKTQTLIEEVRTGIENHKYGEVGQKLYDFTWNDVADWAIESSKSTSSPSVGNTLKEVLETLLKLLHPYTPFVTEQIWEEIGNTNLLALEDFPEVIEEYKNTEAEEKFEIFQNVTAKIRSLRSAAKVDPVKKIKAILYVKNTETLQELQKTSETIQSLARLESLTFITSPEEKPNEECISDIINATEIFLPLAGMLDMEKEKVRKEKELENAKKILKNLEGRIANKKYMDNAPENLVQQTMKQYEEIKEKIAVLEK